jgi:hypothetical protein
MKTQDKDDDDVDDLDVVKDRLNGVEEIATFLKLEERRTGYLISRRIIPAGREGGRVVGSKAVLRGYYRRMTAGGKSP